MSDETARDARGLGRDAPRGDGTVMSPLHARKARTERTRPPQGDPDDTARVRALFPALDQRVNGKPLVYLDNAASTQKPREVIDAVVRFYETDNANVHRGTHALSDRATANYERARAT